MEEAFSLLAENGVKVRLALTSMLATEADLHDDYLNGMLSLGARYGAEAIVYADAVADYVHERYGIDYFKIVGHGAAFRTVLEVYVCYLVRPEYRDDVKRQVVRAAR